MGKTTKSTTPKTTDEKTSVEKTAGKPKVEKVTKTVKPKVEKTKVEKPKVEKTEVEKEDKKAKTSKKAKTNKKAKTDNADKNVQVTKTKASKATTTPKEGSQQKPREKGDEIPDGAELPDIPKAKLNAYTYFVAERRPVLNKKNPDWEFAVLTRKVAGEWKALSDEKRKKYQDLSNADAERHMKDIKEWEAACRELGYDPISVRKHLKGRKEKKQLPKGPTRCRTPYAFFMINNHKELTTENMTFKERTQKMASAWKALSEEDRKPYVEQSKGDKKRYEEALDAFLEENPEVTKANKRKRKREEGEPKRAKTAYIFYTIDNRTKVQSENPDMKTTEIMSELGKQWKSLDDSKKSKYVEMAKNDSDRYKQEKEAWDAKKQ